MRKAYIALTRTFFVAALLLSVHSLAGAQDREKFIISARAGGVNAVTGRATVRGRGTGEWQQLMITEDLKPGDVVKTGHDGRVEVLLNPGSYMRLAENSEFELSNDSLENLEVRLISGTAIMEVTGAEDTELLINITTPHTRMAIVRRGLYRVNVVPGDATELIVRKGRVMLEDSHTKVKGGNKVIITGSHSFSIAKLNKAEKKNADSFDNWSQQRAETVAQANQKMKRRDVSLLLASFNNHWSNPFQGGMWVYDRRSGCYTFMPFYPGWGSPYGGSYSNAFFFGRYGDSCCNRRVYPTNGTIASSPYPTVITPSPTFGPPSVGPISGSQPSFPRESPAPTDPRTDRLGDRMPKP